ncbi:MAG: DUF6580 family putative transport protein [bacterium]
MNKYLKFIFALSLVVLGVVLRFVRIEYFASFPNVEPITAISMLGGSILGGVYAIFVPLLTIGISDFIIGNSNIFIFTWSAWIIIGLSGIFLKRISNNKVGKKTLALTGASLLVGIFFYLFTNFGVWATTPMYTKDLSGLLASFMAGLPFLRFNLIGNLLFVPVLSFISLISYNKLKALNLKSVKVKKLNKNL